MGPTQDLREFRVYLLLNTNATGDADPTVSRDLGLLKRDKALQKRYDAWSPGIVKEHGSMGG